MDYEDGCGEVSEDNVDYWIDHNGVVVSSQKQYEEYDHDDWDWERENWNALTDGQYGDYPGPDFDYEVLGF